MPESIHAAIALSYTLAHIDHRLKTPEPPCTRPSSVYKGEVRSYREGEDETRKVRGNTEQRNPFGEEEGLSIPPTAIP